MIERQNFLKVSKYLLYLKEVMQLGISSVERYRFYLRHLLLWADDHDFSKAPMIRPTFPKYLSKQVQKDNSKDLAQSTQKKILDTSKRFFLWAKRTYPRELNTVTLDWIETLRLPRQPQKLQVNVFVTEEDVRKLVMPPAPQNDLALLRDQAAAAFLFLSGMRATAFVTLPCSAIDLENLTVYQWPELGVKTKNGKKATTFLYNVPDLIEPIKRWDSIIRETLSDDACWYAPIHHLWGEQSISQNKPGNNRAHALGRRMKVLFARAQIEYKSPHKFRHGTAVYGLLHAKTLADYKAVSMNLMHENLEITDGIYAPLLSSDVKTRITGLVDNTSQPPDHRLENYLDGLEKEKLGKALLMIAEKLIN